MVIVLEEGTHSREYTNSSIKLIDQVSTRSRLIGIDSVLFLHFYGPRWSQGLGKRTKANYLLAILTKHAWSITCLLRAGIILRHPNKILAHDLIKHCIFYFFGIVQSSVSFNGVNVCWPRWGSQSNTFETVSSLWQAQWPANLNLLAQIFGQERNFISCGEQNLAR